MKKSIILLIMLSTLMNAMEQNTAGPSEAPEAKRPRLDTPAAFEALNSQLFYAARDGKKEEVEHLLDRGADVNYKNQKGLDGPADTPEKRELLKKEGSQGYTPLMIAAWNGHQDIVTLLLDRGAAIEAKANNGYTPLMYAAWNGHKDTITLLLDRGAAIEAKNNNSYTPLMIAALNGHQDIVTLLLDKGAQFFEPTAAALQRNTQNQIIKTVAKTILHQKIKQLSSLQAQGKTMKEAFADDKEKLMALALKIGQPAIIELIECFVGQKTECPVCLEPIDAENAEIGGSVCQLLECRTCKQKLGANAACPVCRQR